ncbi:hypothetical protein CQA38_04915 [Campylobacter sp. MIT 12-5580]|nr:hypothetical protein CQA38_04915 [Campylobacter sp. MIT 12-5580]
MAGKSCSMKYGIKKAFKKGVLHFENLELKFEYKKIKYLRLKANNDGEFKLSIPLSCTESEVFMFLQKNQAWIDKHLKRFLNAKASLQKDTISFLGRVYILRFDENFAKTRLCKNELLAKNKKDLELFFTQHALRIFNFYIQKYQPYFERKVSKISIKKTKTLWGSCNHRFARINLNLRLIHKPLKAIEYVILHELTHLKFPHHQKEFYDFIEQIMPDFRKRQRLLKGLNFTQQI